jgi:DNA-binding NtrC family response regulator
MSLTEERLQEARDRILESFERRYLTELLQETGGRIGTAAKRAGITPRSLYEKMKRLGMDKASFKTRRVVGPRP